MSALEGAWRKLAPAEHHLDDLEGEIARFLKGLGEEIADIEVKEIRLLSGDLARRSPTRRDQAQRALHDFRREYGTLGVPVLWRELLKGSVPHDRVIIDDTRSFNVPPVNTVLKGDTSEITVSSLGGAWFDALWAEATPLISSDSA